MSGKLNEGQSSRLMFVDVSGISNSNPVTYRVSRTLHDLTIPSDKVLIENVIERLWAYMKIKQLLVKMLITDDPTEHARLENEALQMSLQYNFVTRLTSFVVVKSDQEEIPTNYPSSSDQEEISTNRPPSGTPTNVGWKLSSTYFSVISLLVVFVLLCFY